MKHAPSAPYRLGLIADLHCGSKYGLTPPEFRPSHGLPTAPWTHYIWDCWCHFVEVCPPLDALILNGDWIEGENPAHREPNEAVTDDLLVQSDMAIATVKPLLRKVKRFFVVRGTSYHDEKHSQPIERAAMLSHAEPWTANRYTGEVLEAEFHGLTICATHTQTIGAIYAGTVADRDNLFLAAAERLGKSPTTLISIRSHLHKQGIVFTHGHWFVSTPAWKLTTPYANRRMGLARARLLSDVGAIVLETAGHGDVHFRRFEYASHNPDATFRKID